MDVQAPAPRLDSLAILRMRVYATSYAEAVHRIASWASAPESRYICEGAGSHGHGIVIVNGADLVTP